MEKKINFYEKNSENIEFLRSCNKEHEREFYQMVKDRDTKIFNELKDVVPDCKTNLKVGQICTYTNDFGVYFTGHKILGFCNPEGDYGRCIYLDLDCYWRPVRVDNISDIK